MRVLGIETSCDETGVAIYDPEDGIIAHALHSQIETHREFGGVVPELASRDHILHLVPLLHEALSEANTTLDTIDAVAYTAGPGLIGALLSGACFAKSLAYGRQIPALAVNHLEAHILAAKLDVTELSFPFLALLVSGGHTQLIEARKLGDYRLLGDTLDDAVGEAFDKTAKLMGVPYPGGPKLARLADEYDGKLTCPAFPRPMTNRPGLDFSFSGLKTHARIVWEQAVQTDVSKSMIASAFQEAVIETLRIKCQRAVEQTGCKRLVVAGGVSANQALRRLLQSLMLDLQGEVYFPRMAYCMDNGAMVAYAGFLHLTEGEKDLDWSIPVKARWPLSG